MDHVQNCKESKDYCLETCLSVSDDVMYFCKLFFQYLSLAKHSDGDD